MEDLKQAVYEKIKQHPEGVTFGELCDYFWHPGAASRMITEIPDIILDLKAAGQVRGEGFPIRYEAVE